MITLELTGGYVRTRPAHKIGKGNFSKLLNYISRDSGIKKIGGTAAYNTSLGPFGIPFVLKSYHIQADNTIVKRTHCYNDGTLYYGNDVTGALTATNIINLSKNVLPRAFTIQEADNSVLYLLTGKDRLKKYDGNSSHHWEEAGGDLATATNFDYEDGVVHVDRAWYVRHLSSQVDYSESLDAEDIAASIIIGQDRDSYCLRVVVGAGETLFVFKNNSIWQLYGRTSSQFQFREVTNKYGLACKRGLYPVAGGFVFLNTYDKELYWFGGSEASIRPLTESDIRLREIANFLPSALENVDMTVCDNLFRFAFQHKESTINANDCELVYAIDEPNERVLPKWSLIKGTNVWSYSVWDKYGENELVTGRSDIGKMMYHNRGQNFDGVAVETQARTEEVILSESMVCEIGNIFIRSKPGSYNTKSLFRYFLNGRYSDRGEADLSLQGETRTIGLIHLSTQSLLNDVIIPLSEYTIGNSISCEIYDNNLSTELEHYSISFDATELYEIRNQLVGTQT